MTQIITAIYVTTRLRRSSSDFMEFKLFRLLYEILQHQISLACFLSLFINLLRIVHRLLQQCNLAEHFKQLSTIVRFLLCVNINFRTYLHHLEQYCSELDVLLS